MNHEQRRQLSLEHAKTRGMAVQAYQNTLHLHRRWKQLLVGGVIALAALIGAMSAIGIALWIR